MNVDRLKREVTSRFSVSAAEAERLVLEQAARSRRKAAIAAATRHRVLAKDIDFEENPAAWRQEVQRRMQAIEIMEEGVKHLKDLQKLIKRIIEAEQMLIGKKTAKVNNKDTEWWDMQHSGWAMGGREMFAQKLCDILRGLDESKLASYIIDKIGFKRAIPIDEDELPPLVPMGLAPGDEVPGYKETAEDADDVEAMLVRGARGAGRV